VLNKFIFPNEYYDNNNNNPICKVPECQKTSVALTYTNSIYGDDILSRLRAEVK